MKWSNHQQDIFKAINNTTKNIVVEATAGSGKCLQKGTEILMYNGSIKKVEDIIVGDVLMGDNSDPRFVINTNVGYGDMYEVIPQKGKSFTCNDVHIMTLYKYNRYNENELIDIPLNEFLDQEWSRHQNGNYKQFKLQRTGVEFEDKDINIDPYLLGIWLGDGCKEDGIPRFCINSKDIETIEYLKNINIKDLYYKESLNNGKTTALDIKITRNTYGVNSLRNEFRRCIDGENIVIPKNYLINSRANRLSLLAGLLDTDGYYNGYYEITTKYKTLNDDILFLARSLGFAAYSVLKKSRIKELDFEGYYYRISISGELDQIPCLVKRRIASKRKQIKNVLRTGFKVKYVGKDDYYGFAISGNGRFLLGDFTITHNTTTIINGLKLIPKYKKILFSAFNKAIAEELQKRVEPHVEVSTLHSLGLKIISKAYPGKVKINNWKSLNHIAPCLNRWSRDPEFPIKEDEKNAYQFNILNLVNLCRVLMTERSKEAIELVGSRFDLEVYGNQWIHVIEVLEDLDRYNKNPYSHSQFIIDFTDMLELPIKLDLLTPTYDFIGIDECQDLSMIQQKLIFGVLKKNGRFISVGDPYQAIYSFLGADINSFRNFQSQPNTITLPLSVSYRCGKNIVKKTQEVNPVIQAFEGAIDGIVNENGSIKNVKSGDFVLCRNNKPLVTLYFELIASGKKCYIRGKDYGEGLLKIIEKVRRMSKDQMVDEFARDLEYIEEKLKNKGVEKPKNHSSYRVLEEKYDIIKIIVNKAGSVNEAYRMLDKIFNEVGEGIVLSSIHKSKGLEADRVFIIRRDLIPSKYAVQEWSLIQERNLLFVAYSRAKKELSIVTDWTDEPKTKKAKALDQIVERLNNREDEEEDDDKYEFNDKFEDQL